MSGKICNPLEWRLFIDSSKISLKAVLLQNGNVYPSVPIAIAHTFHMKEKYENMSLLLQTVNYSKYEWKICGDLNVIGILLGMQSGFTKLCCFLREWDSPSKQKHYEVRQWPLRDAFIPGERSVKHKPLVKKENILLPSLHSELSLLKNFVKALKMVKVFCI